MSAHAALRVPLLQRLGLLAVRRRVPVLLTALVLVVLAGVLGGGAVSRLSSGGFTDPGAESTRASELLTERFDGPEPNYLLLVTTPAGRTVDDDAVAEEGAALAARLAEHDGVSQVRSYWTSGQPEALRSTDGSSALVLARLAGDEDESKERAGALTQELAGSSGLLEVRAGGSAEVYRQVSATAEEDLVRAELLVFPLTFVLLVVVLGTLVAAFLPLAVGALAVLGTLLVLAVLTRVTDVSIFALNLTTALGLGLSIDYSLFVVARYREELARGATVEQAVVTTVDTAGRTVLYSALTVALSLGALLLFPLYFLRSFSYAGIPVVLIAAGAAVVVLPAALALLGTRVNALRVRKLQRGRHSARTGTVWGRLARVSTRRPVSVATGAVVVLLLLGVPFLSINLGLTDDRNLPPSSTPATVHEQIRTDFGARENDPLVVVSRERVDPEELDRYAAVLSDLDDVARVDTTLGTYQDGGLVSPPGPVALGLQGNGTRLSVVPDVEAMSAEGEALVAGVRSADAPADVLVGGTSARLVDTKDAIADRLPLALGLVAVSVGALLFAFTGGVLVPVKALVVNVLSLSATFGVLVWGFQNGGLQGVAGDFTVTGTTDLATPVLMFCVAFGLSMDYEVFLLSRIREEWDRTGDNTHAVVAGIERTAGIVTAAAALVVVVFLSFATSGITSLKMLGVGLAVAVVVDVTLVRGALVPAVMQLAGAANWWAPAPLRRAYARFGLREGTAGPPPVPVPPVPGALAPVPTPVEGARV